MGLKILHLVSTPTFSGPVENVALLAQAQAALGHDARVAVDRVRPAQHEEAAAPRLSSMGLLSEEPLSLCVKAPRSWFSDVRTLNRLSGEVDVLHCHFSHDHWLAAVASVPQVWLARSVHSERALRRWPPADMWTVPVEGWRARLPEGPSQVFPALVDARFQPSIDRAALRTRLSLPTGPLVGMVSTFQPSRRHDVGLDAFALVRKAHPTAHLVLVGDGVTQSKARAQAESLGLSACVTFVGYQREATFPNWLAALDEVWVLGLGNDFSGRAAAQARSAGVRVPAVDEGALPTVADAVVTPDAQSIAQHALLRGRREVALPNALEVARRMVALYQEGAP